MDAANGACGLQPTLELFTRGIRTQLRLRQQLNHAPDADVDLSSPASDSHSRDLSFTPCTERRASALPSRCGFAVMSCHAMGPEGGHSAGAGRRVHQSPAHPAAQRRRSLLCVTEGGGGAAAALDCDAIGCGAVWRRAVHG